MDDLKEDYKIEKNEKIKKIIDVIIINIKINFNNNNNNNT
jgi:hypothetical protein